MNDYIQAKGVDPNSEKAIDLHMKITSFNQSLKYSVTPDNGLSNGDEVTVSFTYNEELAKSAGIELQNSTYTITVEGLKEPIIVDAFDPSFFDTERGVMIQYDGIVPEGHLEISNKLEDTNPAYLVYYSCDSSDVDYGETVTITASLPMDAAKEGYILKEETYEYPLTGFDYYMTDTKELDTDKTQLETDLMDTITAIASKDGSNFRGNGRWGITNKLNYKFDSAYTSLTDVSLDNFYCLKEKDGCYKKIYVTMHGTINTTDTAYPITGIFEIEDFIIAGDGSLKYKRDKIHYAFYASEDEAYDNELASKLREYNIDKVAFE